MTIKELIEILNEYPEDLEVYYDTDKEFVEAVRTLLKMSRKERLKI